MEKKEQTVLMPKDFQEFFDQYRQDVARSVGSLKGRITKLENRVKLMEKLLKDAHIMSK